MKCHLFVATPTYSPDECDDWRSSILLCHAIIDFDGVAAERRAFPLEFSAIRPLSCRLPLFCSEMPVLVSYARHRPCYYGHTDYRNWREALYEAGITSRDEFESDDELRRLRPLLATKARPSSTYQFAKNGPHARISRPMSDDTFTAIAHAPSLRRRRRALIGVLLSSFILRHARGR